MSYMLRTYQNEKVQGLYGSLAQDQRIEIKGILSFHALSPGRVSVSLLPQSYRALGQELNDPAHYFQESIELRYDEHCRIQQLAFDGRMSFKSREILRSIVTSLDHDRRALSVADLTQSEDDIVGTVEVLYAYDASQDELVKSRLRVLTPSAKGDFRQSQVSFLKSETRYKGLKADRVASWPRIAESRETVRIQNTLKAADATQEKVVRLEAQDALPTVSVKTIDPSRRVEKKPSEAFRGQDRSTIYSAAELRRTSAPDNFEEALDAFVAAMQADDDAKAKKILGAHLLAHPENFEALEEKLKDGEFDTTLAAHIFFLMTRLPLPEAERLLTRIAGDDAADSYLRMQAIISLGDVREPSPEARKVLMAIAARGPGERDPADKADMGQRLHNTSVLAYGAMASQAADVDPGFENEAKQNFKQLLENADKPEIMATVIAGLGNFHHDDFYEVLEEKLAADEPGVRVSAANAFAKMERPEAESILIQRLQKDSNADVRATLAKGLLDRDALDGGHIPPLAQVLKQEPASKTRNLLIDVLGRAAPAHPKAVDVLVEQAARETDALTLQRIGQYVPAEKLLLAVKPRGT
jgi:HEAT repeat protein